MIIKDALDAACGAAPDHYIGDPHNAWVAYIGAADCGGSISPMMKEARWHEACERKLKRLLTP